MAKKDFKNKTIKDLDRMLSIADPDSAYAERLRAEIDRRYYERKIRTSLGLSYDE